MDIRSNADYAVAYDLRPGDVVGTEHPTHGDVIFEIAELVPTSATGIVSFMTTGGQLVNCNAARVFEKFLAFHLDND